MYLFIYIFSIFTSLYHNKYFKYFVVPILGLLLILVAGMRKEGVDNDYFSYAIMFKYNVHDTSTYIPFASSEITSYLIPRFFYAISKEHYIVLSFIAYAFFGVGFKIYALRNYKYFLLAIVLYVSNLYFLQEFTTIRAGAASGLLLMAILDLVKKKNTSFFLKVLFATLFHYSSIVFVVVWFVQRFNIKYYLLLGVLAFSLMVPILNLNFVTLLYLDQLFPKAAIYLEIMKSEQMALNLFNFRILIAFALMFVFLIFRKRINFEGFDLFLKIHILSLIFFYLFSTLGLAFSLRLFEMFSIVQLVLFPLLVLIFPLRLRFYGYLTVLGIGTLYFFYNIYLSGIIRAYSSWLI